MGFQLSGQTGPFLAVLKKIMGHCEQLLRAVFHVFRDKKNKSFVLNIVAFSVKNYLAQNRLRHTQLNVSEKEELPYFLYLIQIFGGNDDANPFHTDPKIKPFF